MAIITKPYTFANGNVADGTQVNADFDTLYTLVNGNLGAANIEDGVIPVISAAWPVGSVFTSVVATNPNTLLGFGTWGAIATGRVLVGLDSGDENFNAVRKTGGAKTVQASAQSFTGSPVASGPTSLTWGSDIGNGASTLDASTHTHPVTAKGSNAPGAATSVVQPYFVVYFWERTA